DDTGTLVLNGTGSHTGRTAINSRVLQVPTSALPTAGAVTNTAALVFNQSASRTYSGNIAGRGALTLPARGAPTARAGTPSSTGGLGELAILAGTVSIAPPSTGSYGFAISNSGNTWTGDLEIANPIELRLQGGIISGGGKIRVKPATVQILSRGATTISNEIVL